MDRIALIRLNLGGGFLSVSWRRRFLTRKKGAPIIECKPTKRMKRIYQFLDASIITPSIIQMDTMFLRSSSLQLIQTFIRFSSAKGFYEMLSEQGCSTLRAMDRKWSSCSGCSGNDYGASNVLEFDVIVIVGGCDRAEELFCLICILDVADIVVEDCVSLTSTLACLARGSGRSVVSCLSFYDGCCSWEPNAPRTCTVARVLAGRFFSMFTCVFVGTTVLVDLELARVPGNLITSYARLRALPPLGLDRSLRNFVIKIWTLRIVVDFAQCRHGDSQDSKRLLPLVHQNHSVSSASGHCPMQGRHGMYELSLPWVKFHHQVRISNTVT